MNDRGMRILTYGTLIYQGYIGDALSSYRDYRVTFYEFT